MNVQKFEEIIARIDLERVTKEEIGSLLSNEIEVDEAIVRESAMFAYTGFDPSFIMKHMIRRAEGNFRDLFRTIHLIICFVIIRGTNVENAKKKMDKNGIQLITAIMAKYQIKGTSSKERITIGSIAACFPQVYASILAKKLLPPIAGITIDGFRSYYQFPGAPAIIPEDDAESKANWIEWSVRFSKIVSAKHSDKKTDAVFKKESEKYFDVISKGSVNWTQEKRIELRETLEAIVEA